MNKRLVWLAPIALAVLLSGCSISVHTAYLAPRDLTRHSVELTNRMRTGPEARFMETYNFNSMGDAITDEFERAKAWSYERHAPDTATLSLTFATDAIADLLITCELTFDNQDGGTHECDYEFRTSRMGPDRIEPAGSSIGTFRISAI